MPTLVPEKMPSGSSAAERRFFDLLMHAPEDVFAVYEPLIARRKPDFVVIVPDTGIIIVEIKGLRLKDIININNQEMTYLFSGNEKVTKTPFRQATDYMRLLMKECEESLFSTDLLREGRFNVAFGTVVVFPEINRSELDAHPFHQFFPRSQTVCRDELPEPEDTEALLRLFRAAIDPIIPVRRLERRQVDALRHVLHPELTIPVIGGDVRWLDQEQAKVATALGSGHRIITGVPGSGKTIMILSRAKLAAKDGKKILILCYNIALEQYIRQSVRHYPSIQVHTFGKWARSQGAPVNLNDKDAFGNGLLQTLESGGGEARRYDVVLIDEAQDFAKSWFRCALLALNEGRDGDLVIAYDGAQQIYQKTRPKWSDLGINARGRSRRFDRNYRNTRQIARVAQAFAGPEEEAAADDVPEYTRLNYGNCTRAGPDPILIDCRDLRDQIEQAAEIARKLTTGRLVADVSEVPPTEIAILAPPWEQMLEALRGACRAQGLQEVAITTIRKAKGLQWRAVIVLWAHGEDPSEARPLLYVAMTRPEDILVVLTNPQASMAQDVAVAFRHSTA